MARIDIGFIDGPGDRVRMAIDERAVWVSDGFGTIYRIDPGTDEIVAELSFDPPVASMTAGEGALWVADGEQTVYRIDPSAFEAVAP